MEVRQIQFTDRVSAIPVVTQKRVPTVQTVQQKAEIPQVRSKVVDVPVNSSDKLQQLTVDM